MTKPQGKWKQGIWYPAVPPKKTLKLQKKPLKFRDFQQFLEKIHRFENQMLTDYHKVRELQANRMSIGRKIAELRNELRQRSGFEAIEYGKQK